MKTAGLTLEEIGSLFGDKVQIEFNNALEDNTPEKPQVEEIP
jgi:hypothetical protein